MKIAVIGGGVMGEVMLSAILDKRLSTPQAIWVSDIKEARLQHLSEKYGVVVTSSNRSAVEEGEIVIMAIKPQNLFLCFFKLCNFVYKYCFLPPVSIPVHASSAFLFALSSTFLHAGGQPRDLI